MPVVVGPEHSEGKFLVLRPGEILPTELGIRREIHRGQNTIGVHVTDPLVNVEASRSHFAEPGGFDAVFVGRASGNRIEPDVRRLLTLKNPCLGAVVLGDHRWRPMTVRRRDVIIEHVRRLYDVVINRNQDQIATVHSMLLGSSSNTVASPVDGNKC